MPKYIVKNKENKKDEMKKKCPLNLCVENLYENNIPIRY